jgi:DNA-binding transcriptional MerR regulator
MGGSAARHVRPDGLYSSKEASVICGVSWRTICYWESCGLAIASVPSHGTGTDRWYNVDDLVCLRTLARLGSKSGAKVRRAVMIALRGDEATTWLRAPLAEGIEISVDVRRMRREVEERRRRVRNGREA